MDNKKKNLIKYCNHIEWSLFELLALIMDSDDFASFIKILIWLCMRFNSVASLKWELIAD